MPPPSHTPLSTLQCIQPLDADTDASEDVGSQHVTKSSSLSGMPLVHYTCRKRKKVYDKCVKQWYSREFLPGKSVDQDEACGDLFENYRTCVLKGIRKEVWDKQGLPAPKEGSPLAEVEEEDAL